MEILKQLAPVLENPLLYEWLEVLPLLTTEEIEDVLTDPLIKLGNYWSTHYLPVLIETLTDLPIWVEHDTGINYLNNEPIISHL